MRVQRFSIASGAWRSIIIVMVSVQMALSGCAVGVLNPAFPLGIRGAGDALESMREQPVSLKRPVVVLAGYQDPGFASMAMAARVRRMFANGGQVISIAFFNQSTFDECRDKVITMVDAAFPSNDPIMTTPVDVIGISMGGLVARHAARLGGGDDVEHTNRRRLQVHRLFTIATPHQGARMAGLPSFDKRQHDMRAGSAFLEELNADPTTQDFPIIPYARLGDWIVGVENAAMPEEHPYWVSARVLHPSHLTVASDPRVLADIVRRLRDDAPFTKGQPLPPPSSSHDDVADRRFDRIRW
ncbi:MAG: esterase/lipase family protein [Phycisphaerales bacterium]